MLILYPTVCVDTELLIGGDGAPQFWGRGVFGWRRVDRCRIHGIDWGLHEGADAGVTWAAETGLKVVATLANGQTLPSWLTFDPETKTFTSERVPDGVKSFEVRFQTVDGGFFTPSNVSG